MKGKIFLAILGLIIFLLVFVFITSYAVFFILLGGVCLGGYFFKEGSKLQGALIMLGSIVAVGCLAGFSTYAIGKLISIFTDRVPYTLEITGWFTADVLHSPADKMGRLGLLLGMFAGLFVTRLQSPPKTMHGVGWVQGYPVVEGGWADPESISEIAEFGPPIIEQEKG